MVSALHVHSKHYCGTKSIDMHPPTIDDKKGAIMQFRQSIVKLAVQAILECVICSMVLLTHLQVWSVLLPHKIAYAQGS